MLAFIPASYQLWSLLNTGVGASYIYLSVSIMKDVFYVCMLIDI